MSVNDPAEYVMKETGEPLTFEEEAEKDTSVDESLEDVDAEETEDEEGTEEAEETSTEDEDADEDTDDDDDAPEDTDDEDEDEIPRQVDAIAGLLAKKGIDYNGIVAEFQANGRLTAETITKLEKAGYPEGVVSSYIKGQQALYDRYADKVKAVVGGEKKYTELWQWAKDNLSKREKQEFNAAVESGDIGKAKFALNGLKARYQNKEGTVAKLVKGAPTRTKSVKAFTEAELVKALDDPRYEHDIEFTRKVNQKLLATDF